MKGKYDLARPQQRGGGWRKERTLLGECEGVGGLQGGQGNKRRATGFGRRQMMDAS